MEKKLETMTDMMEKMMGMVSRLSSKSENNSGQYRSPSFFRANRPS